MDKTAESKAGTCEGTVKSFDAASGHGTITQADLSVNRDALKGDGAGPHNLAVGDRVRYEVAKDGAAPHAINVHKL